MSEWISMSEVWAVVISLLTYELGNLLQKKTKWAIFNPLLVAMFLIISFLTIFRMDYSIYQEKTKYISFLLTPATVCLAIPLYEKMQILKKNWKAILVGIGGGVLTSMCAVLGMAKLMKMSYEQYVTLLPKSITTAIGIGVVREFGGYETITVAAIILTGIVGNICAEPVCRIFKIKNPIAKGVAIGTGAHVIGTTKAMEMGEIEGAMSSLSIVVAGMMTVLLAPFFT